MNLDAPDSVIFENLVTSLYETHPIRVPILGSHESIREITPEVLYSCHRAFYTPGNMLLCVVGDVDAQEVKNIALQVLGTEKREVGQKKPIAGEDLTTPEKEARCKMEVAMPMFNLAFKCPAVGKGEEAIRQEMVADLAAEALFGESSQLYLELYQEGIIDTSFGGGFETIDGCAMLLCSGDSNMPEVIRERLIRQAEILGREGIGEEDFLRMKRSAFGRRVRGLDSFDSTCFRICAYHFGGFDYFRFPEVYETISKEEIQDFLKNYVNFENSSLSVIDPVEQEAV